MNIKNAEAGLHRIPNLSLLSCLVPHGVKHASDGVGDDPIA